MSPIPINIAVEDLLSEAVAKQLLRESGKPFAVGAIYNRGGFGYLKKTTYGWNNAAKGVPFFLLTDLDNGLCPQTLRNSWLSESLHPNFLFRVAVREIESWLLADRLHLSKFLRVPQTIIPHSPDMLVDAKAELVSVASKSPIAGMRSRIVPKSGTTAKQGRDYNSCLIEFVTGTWDPLIAASSSPSLERCRRRLHEFHPVWT